jgi:hypothetical protein
MALTQEIEQKLERASLIAYFRANQTAWQDNVQDAYDYTKKAFAGVTIRPDDVAKTLRPVVEIDKPLRRTLDQKRLSQKYWVDYFTFLVIDRAWDTLKK